MKNKIEELLNEPKKLLMEAYFEIQEIYEEKYGENTVVLLELGSFFEAYEVNNEEERLGKAKEISEILNIQLTRKNKSLEEINRKNPYMAGVPTVSLDKHLNKLISLNKYTIILIKQEGETPNVRRYVGEIISPGTNFDYIQNKDFNYLTSVVIEQYKGVYSIGYSSIDVTTGKLYTNETHSMVSDKTLAIDYLKLCLSTKETSEIVITTNDKKIKVEELVKQLGLKEKTVHLKTKRIKNSTQNNMFKTVFNVESFLSPIEYLDLELEPLASESLYILLNFVLEHDVKILDNVHLPEKITKKDKMYLGNNALEQLNIKEKDSEISIFKILDKTRTTIGRRLLKDRLYNPITNKEELERRYDLTEKVKDIELDLIQRLNGVYDLERLLRRIELKRLHPYEINYFYNTCESICNIYDLIVEKNITETNINKDKIKEVMLYLEDILDLSETKKTMFKDIDKNFISKGKNQKLDKVVGVTEEIIETLNELTKQINSYFGGNVEYCKWEQTKEGFHLTMTKSKCKDLKTNNKELKLKINGKNYDLFKDFDLKQLTNSCKIKGELIDQLSEKYIVNQKIIVDINKEIFLEILDYITKYFTYEIQESIYFVADLDVAITNLFCSKKLNLTRPTIFDFKEHSYVEAVQLRHILVEVNEDNGLYVPNDIVLGQHNNYKEKLLCTMNEEKEVNGALIYGINSSGKSTMLKSLGVSTILAQSGFYVPAKSFSFTLMDNLFTRIQGNDNIYQGLSSFAVEMLELKNIFNRANKKTMILGDELSHSTETVSGVSIVASSLMKFKELQSLYILATHLHQLPDIEEINEIEDINYFHLSTDYNPETNEIKFDRILKKGKGSSIYGLEFAASLELDNTFLKNAESIRKKITNDYSDVEKLGLKSTRYNDSKEKINCEVCGENAEDTHHITEQHKFKNGQDYFENVKKNHKHNLMSVCKKCHKDIHDNKIIIKGYVKTSKGFKLDFEKVENER